MLPVTDEEVLIEQGGNSTLFSVVLLPMKTLPMISICHLAGSRQRTVLCLICVAESIDLRSEGGALARSRQLCNYIAAYPLASGFFREAVRFATNADKLRAAAYIIKTNEASRLCPFWDED